MSLLSVRRFGVSLLSAGALVAALTAPAAAQDPAPNPNGGNIHISGATDFTNAYMFRGIRQDDTKVIIWPYFDLGLGVYSGEGGLKSVAIDFGTWNSVHTGDAGAKSKTSGLGCACGKAWYESDFYATIGFGFGGGTTLSSTYTAYTSPNNGFSTVKEILFKVAVDDTAYLHKASLKPYALIGFEFDTAPGQGQADGGKNAGKYVEIGAAPGYTWPKAGISVPVKVGLSAGDYYEDPVTGKDSTFGYFSVAGIVTVPFTSAPTKFGTWNVHGGVEFQTYGDSLTTFNNGDGHKTIGSIGIGFTY